MSKTPNPDKKLSNTIKIEKDKKTYNLNIITNESEITLKCRIKKPLKIYEKKYSKSDLEDICKIFKSCDNISEAYSYILNSLENKQFDFSINEDKIIIKLNKINIFEFKDIILTEKEIEANERIDNLYEIQEDLMKEIESLKNGKDNLNNMKEDYELISVDLKNGSNHGSGYNPFRVYRMKNNFVKLSGLINCSLGSDICQLPENCRPNERLIFICMASNNPLRVDVCSNGNVYPYGSGSSWLSLDNIFFLAGK